MANAGGANGDGTVFEFAKTGASYTLKALASFTSANGTGPEVIVYRNPYLLAGFLLSAVGLLLCVVLFIGESRKRRRKDES